MDPQQMFLNMMLNSKKSSSTTNTSEDKEESNTIVIPIIHNEVSQLAKYFDIKEPMINFKTLERVKEIIIETKNKDIDILLESGGGELNATKMICDTLMTYKKCNPKNKIRAYVRQSAMSGATLIALCADELYMSDYAHLGLVDPQIFGFSNKELSTVYNRKSEKTWDVTMLLHTKSEYNLNLVTTLLDKILVTNPKYSKKNSIISNYLLNGEVHGAGFTVDELKEFGIERDGTIPDHISETFKSRKEDHKTNNSNLISSMIN